MYAPTIVTASARKHFRVGPHDAALLEDVVAVGSFDYRFVLEVRMGENAPFFYVTAERLTLTARLEIVCDQGLDFDFDDDPDAALWFLGTYHEDGHANLGSEEDWSDFVTFERAALEIVARRLNATPVLIMPC